MADDPFGDDDGSMLDANHVRNTALIEFPSALTKLFGSCSAPFFFFFSEKALSPPYYSLTLARARGPFCCSAAGDGAGAIRAQEATQGRL